MSSGNFFCARRCQMTPRALGLDLFAIAFACGLNDWAFLYFGWSVSKRTFSAESLQSFSGLIADLGMHCLGLSCQNEIPRPFQLVGVGGCFFVFL